MAASLSELFQKLSITDNRLSVLLEIKRAIFSVQLDELKVSIKNLSLEPIFVSLGTPEKEALQVGSDVLSRLLDCLEPEVVLAQLRDELYMGIGHPHESIRHVCLHQIDRLVASEVGRNNLKNDEDMLAIIVSSVADESLGVAKVPIKTLKVLAGGPSGARVLFEGSLLEKMKHVAGQSDTVKYRVLEIACAVAALSDQLLEIVSRSGLLQLLLADIHTEDDLIQLNAIEMLGTLVEQPHSVAFLEREGVLQKVEQMLVEAEGDPSQSFLLPGLIKFFGALSHRQPKEVAERYPAFLQCSFKLLEGCEAALVNIAIETVGFVGKSTEGKRVLNKQGKPMVDALSILGRLVQVPPTEVRVRALSALASLFSIQKDEMNEDLESMFQQWFSKISPQPMDLLLSLCRQPFLDLRCPSFEVLAALCGHRWAQGRLVNTPGFQEYLLDRSTESDKVGKEAKFAVVKALAEAYHTGEIFGQPYKLKLREYVRDGPFYVKVQSEVAFEGN